MDPYLETLHRESFVACEAARRVWLRSDLLSRLVAMGLILSPIGYAVAILELQALVAVLIVVLTNAMLAAVGFHVLIDANPGNARAVYKLEYRIVLKIEEAAKQDLSDDRLEKLYKWIQNERLLVDQSLLMASYARRVSKNVEAANKRWNEVMRRRSIHVERT